MITQAEFDRFPLALQSDIRLEVIVADLLTDNLNPDDVMIRNDGLFKRNYHYDIETSGEIAFGPGKKKKMLFVVNREGIYDQLPEDLFHQVSDTGNVSDKYEVIREIKEQQDIEKQTRLFFQPVEQEFYNQRIKLELEERKFLFESSHVLPGEIFNDLWDLPDFLDDLQKSKLGLLMPVIYKLTCRQDILSFVFESITGDPVEIRTTAPEIWEISEAPLLGHLHLSVNSTLDGSLKGLQPAFKVVIYPFKNSLPADYMPGGKKLAIHQLLCDLLMPMDAEIFFETEFSGDSASFLINNETDISGRLNYTTII